MRRSPVGWVITALLMFQLAFGLQWQVARAVEVPPEQPTSGMEGGHCPAHQAKRSGADEGLDANTSTSPQSSHNHAAPKHDCCRSLGCQCHCAQSPGVLDFPRAGAPVSSSFFSSICDARPPVSRTNDFFRPPIA